MTSKVLFTVLTEKHLGLWRKWAFFLRWISPPTCKTNVSKHV